MEDRDATHRASLSRLSPSSTATTELDATYMPHVQAGAVDRTALHSSSTRLDLTDLVADASSQTTVVSLYGDAVVAEVAAPLVPTSSASVQTPTSSRSTRPSRLPPVVCSI